MTNCVLKSQKIINKKNKMNYSRIQFQVTKTRGWKDGSGSRVLAALPEVPGFIASTHTAVDNYSGPRRYDTPFWPPLAP